MEASSDTLPDRSGSPPRPTLVTSRSDSTARHACSTASRLDPAGPLKDGQPAVVAIFPKLHVAKMIGSGICFRVFCETVQESSQSKRAAAGAKPQKSLALNGGGVWRTLRNAVGRRVYWETCKEKLSWRRGFSSFSLAFDVEKHCLLERRVLASPFVVRCCGV